jgi:autotransporter-associated beta strand protein
VAGVKHSGRRSFAAKLDTRRHFPLRSAPSKRAGLASTAVIALIAAALLTNAAFAQSFGGGGGAGNGGQPGGAGGGFGTPGNPGAGGPGYPAGGGGGGAGAAGGDSGGGGPGGGAGASGSVATPGATGGGGGNNAGLYTGGGGGGGGGNGILAVGGGTATISAPVSGGGGGGGGVSGFYGAGGGGGSGGYGIAATGGAFDLTTAAAVTGGNGGNGGNGSGGSSIGAGGYSGSGGDGGAGVYLQTAGSSLNVTGGTITGGNGGIAGVGGYGNGAAGQGGVGVSGAGLTIINAGTISGGLANGGAVGAAQADAIVFTSGTNSLTLSSGGVTGTLNGGIGISGSLSIDPGTSAGIAVTLSSQIHDYNGGPGSLTKSGAGTLVLTGANSYTGGTTVSAGTLRLSGSGTLGGINNATTVNGGTAVLDLGGTSQTQNGGVTLQGGGTIKNGTLFSSGIFDMQSGTVYAILSGTGGITKTTAGTVTLSGANSYTGGTTVSAGTLQLSALGTLGDGGTTTVNGGTAVLDLGGTMQIQNGGVTLQGGGTIQNGALASSGTFALQSGTVSAVLAGPGSVSKTTAGTVTLSGANTYTGGTTVSGGTLAISNNNALGSGSLTLDPFTTLHLEGVQIANAVNVLGATNLVVTGASAMNTISGSGTVNITGTSGSATTDVLTLNGPNSYTAATLVGDGTTADAVTLKGGAANAFSASSAIAVTQYSVLDLGGFNQSIASLSGGGTVTNSGASVANALTISSGVASTFSGTIQDGTNAKTALTLSGTGTALTLSGSNTYSGATTVTGASLIGGAAGAFSASSVTTINTGGTVDLGGFAQTINTVDLAGGTIKNGVLTGAISSTFGTVSGIAGTATVETTAGTTMFSGTNTYSGTTTVDAGSAAWALSTGGLSSGSAFTVNGMLDLQGHSSTIKSLSGGGIVALRVGTLTLSDAGDNFSGAITGSGGLTLTAGTETLTGTNTYTGVTTVNGGTLALSGAGSVANSSQINLASSGTTFDISGTSAGATITTLAGAAGSYVMLGGQTLTLSSASTTYAGTIQGTGGLTLTAGTEILTGNNTYGGLTTINGGTLALATGGAIAGSVLNNATFTTSGTVFGLLTNAAGITTDNGMLNGGAIVTGGALTGTGSVSNLTMTGGTFAPGNGTPGSSMAVTGNLAFQSGALYLVQINPATSSFASVTGAATLGGATVNAIYANGSYVAKQYTILTAGSVNGNFGSVVNTNLPSGFHASLSHDSTHAYLDLALNFVPPPGSGLSGNQQRVANAVTGFFNSNGGISLAFGGLTPGGLTQAAGETAVGSQQTTFDAMGQFMGVMTDPFIAGRGDPVQSSTGAPQFAEEIDGATAYADNGTPRSKSERDAYAAIYRKAPVMADPFAQRWSVWAAGYGGSQTTDGNAALGSNTVTSSVYGTAVGADYRFSRDTIAGFALAGGGTNFSVNGAGSGRSDLFQAGAFIRHNFGPAYISAALAYGWQEITTDRTVTIAGVDQLHAQFNANAYSGRVEGGYRYVTPWMGLTPYAGAQFTTFDLPAYAERAIVGANTFALSYGANSVTDSRSELGIRTDKSFAMPDSVLTLRGRLAWAHDYNPDRSISATFQTLPGASFVVNGAAQASDAALTTASAEIKWMNGWSSAATFEGEFSGVTRSYAGKGVVRYAW